MTARMLPLLLLCACASAAPPPATDQPVLVGMALPYARQLQAVGVTRVISPGNRAMVLLETAYGPVYVRYPAAAEPLAFVLEVGPEGLRASATALDRADYGKVISALVPDAVQAADINNRQGWLRANPWH
jgi:hypothetical protein